MHCVCHIVYRKQFGQTEEEMKIIINSPWWHLCLKKKFWWINKFHPWDKKTPKYWKVLRLTICKKNRLLCFSVKQSLQNHAPCVQSLPNASVKAKEAAAQSSRISFIILLLSTYRNQYFAECWAVYFWSEMMQETRMILVLCIAHLNILISWSRVQVTWSHVRAMWYQVFSLQQRSRRLEHIFII